MSKLKLSIINTYNQMAQDTSGLLLCCTSDDNGKPVVHRVIATQSIVGLLCELKTEGSRTARRVCYDQGIGKIWYSEWTNRTHLGRRVYEYKKRVGYDENKVFIKTIPYSFGSATGMAMNNLRWAIIEHNVFSIKDAEEALKQERIEQEEERQKELASVKQNELEALLQNLDEDQIEILKEFVTKDENLCKQIVSTLLSRL